MPLVVSYGYYLYYAAFNIHEQGHAQLGFQQVPLILPEPYDVSKYEPRIVGSCNGLLCLYLTETYLLWNPATRTHHLINHPNFDPERRQKGHHIDVHGLGYVELHDDFKFVVVYQFVGHEDGIKNIDPEVWVYSLNAMSWSKIDSDQFPYHLNFGREYTDVFLHGCLHYIVNRKIKSDVEGDADIIDSEYLIAAFDVAEETYKLVPKPNAVNSDQEFELGILDERLCMLLSENGAGRFRLLEMRVYGDESSWNELFRFEKNDGPFWMRPITSAGDQETKQILMGREMNLFCFHVGSNSFREFFAGNYEFTEMCLFMPSQRRLDTDDDDLLSTDSDE